MGHWSYFTPCRFFGKWSHGPLLTTGCWARLDKFTPLSRFAECHTLSIWDIISGWWFQILFIFTPKIGEDSHFDEHIFQMGWFNHQLVIFRSESIGHSGGFALLWWSRWIEWCHRIHVTWETSCGGVEIGGLTSLKSRGENLNIWKIMWDDNEDLEMIVWYLGGWLISQKKQTIKV